MIDWSETRLRIQLWLHQSWPSRVLARVLLRRVPESEEFGRFRGGSENLDEIAKLESPEARPESAAELLNSLRTFPPGQIHLFGQPCCQEDVDAVLTAADPRQAARDLMTKRLNESNLK